VLRRFGMKRSIGRASSRNPEGKEARTPFCVVRRAILNSSQLTGRRITNRSVIDSVSAETQDDTTTSGMRGRAGSAEFRAIPAIILGVTSRM